MVFELFDVGIIMAAAAIIVAGMFFAGAKIAEELWLLNEQIKKGALGNSEKQRDEAYQKKLEELKAQFPDKFPGLTPVDPTKKT